MDIESIFRETFGNNTSSALEITDHIPPRIEYQGRIFNINTDLFKGRYLDWVSEERWRNVFGSSFTETSSHVTREFFGTVYEFDDSKSIKITPLRVNDIQLIDEDHRYEDLHISIEIRWNYGYYYYIHAMLIGAEENIRDDYESIQFIEKADVMVLEDLKALTCDLKLVYEKLHEHPRRLCNSTEKFHLFGTGRGCLEFNVDHPINSMEDAIQEIKNKSVLYKFFSLL